MDDGITFPGVSHYVYISYLLIKQRPFRSINNVSFLLYFNILKKVENVKGF